MKSFHCPFCDSEVPITSSTFSERTPSFLSNDGTFFNGLRDISDKSAIKITFYKCPKCNFYSIFASEYGEYSKGLDVPLIPKSRAKQFPAYIPKAIRQDYEEAYSIVHLSPKASATLARRCLQGMIRDFWSISKNRLVDEINELQNVVPTSQWKAIDSLRKIGNIGAHMESDINTIVDVDPDEAEKLLKLIELLIDKWYIARHDEEELLADISGIATNKSNQKSSSSQS